MNEPQTDPGTDTDTELHELMDRIMADLDTPIDRLQERSMARGRTVRRRRRTIAALGGVAAAALVAAVALPSLAGTDDAGRLIAHDSGDPSPDTYVRPAGWWDMPGAEMRDRLDDLLAPGLTITDANLGDEDLAPGEQPQGGWIALDLADSDGRAGGLNVILYPPFDDDGAFVRERTTCPGNLAAPARDTCTELLDSSGAVVGRTSRWASGGVVVLAVTRLTPDGALVYAAASNSSDNKWGVDSSIDRSDPAVRPAQLRAIAESPTWQDWTPQR